MALLPQIVWLGRPVEDRYNEIIGMGDICTRAVATAIAHNDYHSALEWLEEGRSIVWRQMTQLRTPMDELFNSHPKLAAKLKQVAFDLDHAGSRPPLYSTAKKSNEQSLEEAARRHRRLAEKWEFLVTQARQLPGHEGFMRTRTSSELTCSAHSGTVVMLNLHQDRCDALVIRSRSADISHLPLTQFSPRRANHISAKMSTLVRSRGSVDRAFIKPNQPTGVDMEGMLMELWSSVVKPVLEFLGYNVFEVSLFVSAHL